MTGFERRMSVLFVNPPYGVKVPRSIICYLIKMVLEKPLMSCMCLSLLFLSKQQFLELPFVNIFALIQNHIHIYNVEFPDIRIIKGRKYYLEGTKLSLKLSCLNTAIFKHNRYKASVNLIIHDTQKNRLQKLFKYKDTLDCRIK